MMRRVSWMVIFCMLVTTIGTSIGFENAVSANANLDSSTATTNLVKNGGFEETKSNSAWVGSKGPDSWGQWVPKGSPQLSLDTRQEGDYSVKIAAASQSRATINQKIAVQPNKRYLLSFWVKMDKIQTPTSYGGVFARNSFHRSLTSDTRIGNDFLTTDKLLGTNDWTYMEYEYISPADANALLIELFLEESTGTVWFDEISVVEVGEAKLFAIPKSVSLNEGENFSLIPTFYPTDLSNRTITWESNDNSVATVDEQGVITAVSGGAVTITGILEDGGYRASITVSVQGAAMIDAMDTIRARWYEKLTGNNGYTNASAEYKSYYDRLATDKVLQVKNDEDSGFWDLMNTEAGRTFLWADLINDCSPAKSYSRLKDMALAYAMKGSELQGNTALGADIISGLEWLYANKYNESMTSKSACGWDFEIGIVQSLDDILVLMHDELTVEQINKFVKPIDKFGDPTKFNMHNATPSEATGANRSDKALGMALRAAVGKDAGKLTIASAALDKVFPYVTSGDGFYEDGSFVQHNYIAYTGSYGGVLLNGMSSMLYILAGTPWDVTANPEHANIYSWITESYEPLIYNGKMMEMVYGRAISRAGNTYGAPNNHVLLLAQAASDAAVKSRFNQMVKEWYMADSNWDPSKITNRFELALAEQILIDENLAPRGDMTKHHVFAAMDRTVHLRPAYAIGLSMFSNRISAFEYGNGENKTGWFTGIGMTSLYTDDIGQFTDNFYNTVDMMRLPGTTTDGSQAGLTDWKNYPNQNNRAGGTSIASLYGVSGMDFSMKGVTGSDLQGKKSWFMFDDEIVALGSGITKPSAGNHSVETIVENRKLTEAGTNELTVNGQSVLQSFDKQTLQQVKWAHLQGNTAGSDIGYYFPKPSDLTALREQRTGSWQQVNKDGSADPVQKNYLSLSFDHGDAPQNGNYSYVLLPNKDAAATAAYSENPQVSIISQTNKVHAVEQKELGILAANFWSAAELEKLHVDQPSSVMLRQEDDKLTVAVSDPLRNQGKITVNIAAKGEQIIVKDPAVSVVQMSPYITLEIDMKQAMGQSRTIELNIDPAAKTELPKPEQMPGIKVSVAQDTYVQAGADSKKNFGKANYLNIRNGDGTFKREVLLKFGLQEVLEEIEELVIEKAVLHVYGQTNDGSGTQSTIGVFGVEDNSWDEYAVTYESKPEAEERLDDLVFDKGNAWRQFDVTAYIQKKLQTDSSLSFALKQVNSNLSAEIRSRENNDGEFASYLQLIVKEKVDPGQPTNPNPNPGGGETNPGGGTDEPDGDGGNNPDPNGETDEPLFTDVAGHWAAEWIAQAAKLEIIKGFEDQSFKPDGVVTRAQFAVMLSKALYLQKADSDNKEATTNKFTFKDESVIPTWAKSHIERITAEGIIKGYTDGTFRAANQITRAELAVMTVRALRLEIDPDADLAFADSEQIAPWAKPYIAAAVKADIVKGKGSNRFAPSETATRAEAVKLVLALLENK